MLNEVLYDFHEPSTAGQSERSLLGLLRLSVDVGSMLNEELNDVLVSLTSSLHQRSVAMWEYIRSSGNNMDWV